MKQLAQITLTLFFLLSLSCPALAITFLTGENITLPKTEPLEQSLFISGKNLTIDSDIDGDLFCAGQTVIINSYITGDVICAAQELTVNGPVDGNIRTGSQLLTINSRVGKNITLGAQKVTLGSDSLIEQDALIGAQTVSLDGTISRDLRVYAQTANLGGEVERNAFFQTEDLSLAPGATVSGQLTRQQANIEQQKEKIDNEIRPRGRIISRTVRFSIALLFTIIGLAIAFFFPKFTTNATQTLASQPIRSFLTGLLLLLVIPLLLLLLLFTLIGIPFAISGFILFGMILAIGRLIPAFALGQFLLNRISVTKNLNPVHWALLGGPITWLLFNFPLFGWLISFIFTCLGLGTLYFLLRPKK